MRLSYILTTACGDMLAAQQHGGGGIYRATMGDRAKLLEEKILPTAVEQDFHEIIVVGRFPLELAQAFPTCTWLTLPPLRRDRIEAFRQREVGTRWSTGDILVMSSDDHALEPSFVDTLKQIANEEWDILTPRRVHAKTLKELNNGRDEHYAPWHTNVYRRHVWAQVPWTAVDTLWCDIILPERYEKLGFKMVWDDRLTCYDLEAECDEE